MSRIIKKKEEMSDVNDSNDSSGEQKMSRIIEVKEELVDAVGNVINEYTRRMYFQTELETEVEIEFIYHAIRLTPEEEDIFKEETLEALSRYLGHTEFYVTTTEDSITIQLFEGDRREFLEELAYQVDKKLDTILEEKGIDPNVKNDHFLNLYTDDDEDDLYEDIRNMYSYEELPYSEHEYTEPVGNIDDSDFIESLDVKDYTENTENTENKSWFSFIKK